jgi:hypothetical protein
MTLTRTGNTVHRDGQIVGVWLHGAWYRYQPGPPHERCYEVITDEALIADLRRARPSPAEFQARRIAELDRVLVKLPTYPAQAKKKRKAKVRG